MILPDKIYVQEIKLINTQNSKTKIQDMVATRHQSSSSGNVSELATSASTLVLPENQTNAVSSQEEDLHGKHLKNDIKQANLLRTGLPTANSEKTTMIILCDDGSLKIYVADSVKTEYWLQPHLQATNAIAQLKHSPMWSSTSLFQLCPSSIFNTLSKKNPETSDAPDTEKEAEKTSEKPKSLKRAGAIKKKHLAAKTPVKAATFPIDFFEKSIQLNDVEYAGNDLLEVYNQQQLKARLSMGGNKFVASTKPNGFTLEISNVTDSARSLLVGCRILIGTHSLERVPQYFQVFNRRLPVKVTRQRWFDICLTREEAILADNKLAVQVGCSSDTVKHITLIDGCVCYVKTRESLNWNKNEAQFIQKRYQQSLEKIKGSDKTSKASLMSQVLVPKYKPEKKHTKELTSGPQHPVEANILVQYDPKPFDCLLGQSLDILENCIILLKDLNVSDENQSFPYSISIDLLSILCPPVITFKAKSLLYNSLTLSSVKSDPKSSTPLGK